MKSVGRASSNHHHDSMADILHGCFDRLQGSSWPVLMHVTSLAHMHVDCMPVDPAMYSCLADNFDP